MDGMLYTSVSHNLAHDIGTFWFPQFSYRNLAGLSSFHEQPPLVFGIQAVFFRLLGDSMYVERFYVFLTMLLNAMLIILIWRMTVKTKEQKDLHWLPVLLWITIPICFWSFSNNMHENTMSIFILGSVFFSLKEIKEEKRNLKWTVFSGICIFLAALSKGIPGLFPLGVPMIYWLTNDRKQFSRYFLQTIILVLIIAVCFSALMMYPDARESLYTYLTKRALNRINEVPTVDSRFYILGRIVSELLPQLILLILFIALAGIQKSKSTMAEYVSPSFFFLLTGLAGSAPLMLTMVQKGFYFVPSLPYFALGFALLFIDPVQRFCQYLSSSARRLNYLKVVTIIVTLTALSLSVSGIGKYSREKDLLQDIEKIAQVVPEHSVLSVTPDVWNNWSIQCYMMRYHFISLDDRDTGNYFLTFNNEQFVNEGFDPINKELKTFNLYKRSISSVK